MKLNEVIIKQRERIAVKLECLIYLSETNAVEYEQQINSLIKEIEMIEKHISILEKLESDRRNKTVIRLEDIIANVKHIKAQETDEGSSGFNATLKRKK